MSTTASASEDVVTPRTFSMPSQSDTVSQSEQMVLPETEKLPNLDQFDPNFEELNQIPEEYRDPIKVQRMLIDERMMASRNQVIYT